ncbi:ATP-binding protein [Streptomyces sp. NPDC093795]|uniref:ATP-binding protein n=1 Tax=Streptomyces sp. NPDC093795 TaxID=3366051 RepID=UPI00382901C5
MVEHPKVWTCGDDPGRAPGARPRGTGGLVGRDAELAELRAALARNRLVTVTGAAGVGKSRLALTVADSPGDGAWRAVVRVRWHDGVPVGPRALTARLVRALTAATVAPQGPDAATVPTRGRGAATVTARGQDAAVAPLGPDTATVPPRGPDTASVRRAPATAHDDMGVVTAVRAVPAEPLLLVLDDVDPVHTECAGLVQRLLMAVPGLRILVTARRALGLGDERVVRVAPLEVDSPADGPEPSPAVELFLARTPSPTPGARPVEDSDLPDVRRVCRLLEGVPLAIELAAGQLGDGTLRELGARLESDQCWLTGPGHGLRRHRSLAASMGAVHALCDPVVRRVWHRASVFEGSFTEATAALLCSGAEVEPDQVPSSLAMLSAAGVLRVHGEPGAVRRPRYRMARAARDFGTERLRGAGEFPAVLARHAIHYRGVAAVAETLWHMGLQQQALRIVLDEYDDLMALVPRALARAEREPGRTTDAEPDRVPERAPHPAPDRVPEGAPDPAPACVPEGAPDHATDPAPDGVPERAPHPAPDRVPEGAPAPAPAPDRSADPPSPPGEHTETALEIVLRLWFWWAVHDRAGEGARLLLGLLPHLPPASPLVARGRWLAAWLIADHDPRSAHRLLDLAWPAAVMAGDDALVGRIAHVHGTLAWRRQDTEAAARYYRLAADTIPEAAPGGPPPAVSLAALAVVQAPTSPETAARTARRALAQLRNRDDTWATALAHYARAFADRSAGRTGRARHRAHRALTHLIAGPDTAPQAHTALRRLLDHLERPADGPRMPTRHDEDGSDSEAWRAGQDAADSGILTPQ